MRAAAASSTRRRRVLARRVRLPPLPDRPFIVGPPRSCQRVVRSSSDQHSTRPTRPSAAECVSALGRSSSGPCGAASSRLTRRKAMTAAGHNKPVRSRNARLSTPCSGAQPGRSGWLVSQWGCVGGPDLSLGEHRWDSRWPQGAPYWWQRGERLPGRGLPRKPTLHRHMQQGCMQRVAGLAAVSGTAFPPGLDAYHHLTPTAQAWTDASDPTLTT